MATQKLSKPWITPFRRCIERKHQLHKDSSIKPPALANSKRYRNTPRNLINTAENNYYNNLFESATHMKTTWPAFTGNSAQSGQSKTQTESK